MCSLSKSSSEFLILYKYYRPIKDRAKYSVTPARKRVYAGREIRTPASFQTPVFETGAFNRSAIPANVSPFEHDAQHKVALARLYGVHRTKLPEQFQSCCLYFFSFLLLLIQTIPAFLFFQLLLQVFRLSELRLTQSLLP